MRILVIFFFVCLTNYSVGQKRIIDETACDNWISLKELTEDCDIVSNDGNYVAYLLGTPDFNNTLVVKQLYGGSFQVEIPNARSAQITQDSRRLIAIGDRDTMIIQMLGKKEHEYIPNVKQFFLPKEGNGKWLTYNLNRGENLIVRNLFSDEEKQYANIENSWFNNDGSILVLQTNNGLELIDLISGSSRKIPNSKSVIGLCFDNTGKQIAFISQDSTFVQLKYYQIAMDAPIVLADSYSKNMEPGFDIGTRGPRFSKNGLKIFFTVKKRILPEINNSRVITKAVNIWSYKDKDLQESQKALLQENIDREYEAVANIASRKIIQLEDNEFRLEYGQYGNDFALLSSTNITSEFYWNNERKKLLLVSLLDGSRKELFNSTYPAFNYPLLSPDERYVVWFDCNERNYTSYDVVKDTAYNISSIIKDSLVVTNQRGMDAKVVNTNWPYRSTTWLNEGQAYLMYSRNDIWRLDPSGKQQPMCLTNHYGRENDITFRLFDSQVKPILMDRNTMLTWAFNNRTKENGFWKIQLDKEAEPVKLIMDGHAYYFSPISVANVGAIGKPDRFAPVKARDQNVYVFRRMSTIESPNLFATKDFKVIKKITDIAPEKEYNWLRSELISWSLPDGSICDGILHKPENFDSTKKYPIIFTYYERHSEHLNVFRYPELSGGPINIPWFVSRGYLVFEPDFYYKRGKTAQSVIDAIKGAVKQLSQYSYIDLSKMGLQGHSHGGYETNILATGTNLFAAACEMAGYSNIISEYGSIRPGGYNNQKAADMDQRNLGVFPWDNPDIFIENSPVFHISKMNTPLLIVHNRNDGGVLFPQAIELFLGMRRIGKKVWMLEYDDEGHTLIDKNNQLDYTIRMQQFFDHYLKGMPAPVWMTQGIPAAKKGIESGLELDSINRVP